MWHHPLDWTTRVLKIRRAASQDEDDGDGDGGNDSSGIPATDAHADNQANTITTAGSTGAGTTTTSRLDGVGLGWQSWRAVVPVD